MTKNQKLRDEAFEDQALGPLERLVLLALIQHRNGKTGACFPSQPRLAQITGLSIRSVYNAIQALEALGWVSRAARPGRPTRYTIPAEPRHVVPHTPARGACKSVSNPSEPDLTPEQMEDYRLGMYTAQALGAWTRGATRKAQEDE